MFRVFELKALAAVQLRGSGDSSRGVSCPTFENNVVVSISRLQKSVNNAGTSEYVIYWCINRHAVSKYPRARTTQ